VSRVGRAVRPAVTPLLAILTAFIVGSIFILITDFENLSKLGTDPTNGLASIEALYVAYHILGRPTEGLLDHYRWANEFLDSNGLS